MNQSGQITCYKKRTDSKATDRFRARELNPSRLGRASLADALRVCWNGSKFNHLLLAEWREGAAHRSAYAMRYLNGMFTSV